MNAARLGRIPFCIEPLSKGPAMRSPSFLAGVCVCLASLSVQAAPVPISGYDINDAIISGHGSWSHIFSGTITPGVAFLNNSFGGTTATYSGVGSGTLNDGIISASISSSQLFVTPMASDGTAINPTVFLTLPFAYTIDNINIFGGDITDNAIPGAITGVTVTLLKTDFTTVSETFATTASGPTVNSIGVLVNDAVSLIGSTLDGVPAFAVFLSAFQGTIGNWFSIAEIELDGTQFVDPGNNVPEPTAMVLFGLGAVCLVAARRWRRRTSPA